MHSPILKWFLYLFIAFVCLLGIAAGVVAYEARSFRDSDLIARNVTIAGLPVGETRRADAVTKLQEQWLPTLPQELKLTHGTRNFPVDAAELGREPQLEKAVGEAMKLRREPSLVAQVATRVRLLRAPVDVPVEVVVDQTKAESEVAQVAEELDRDPVNARVTLTGGDGVDVVPGKPGLKVDQPASVAAIEKALQSLKQATVALVVKEKQPPITGKDLAHLECVLGRYRTDYDSGKTDRSHNLSLAIKAINGKVIMPGEEFSTDLAIGPREVSKGYRDAPIFVEGEITPATGGGICQIATTVYNAALLAGLPIVERHHHSMPVHYAPPGRDATVYSGQYDLRFRNNTSGPIVLISSMDGDQVSVALIGKREAKKKVRITSSGVSSISYSKKEILDPKLPLGKKIVEKPGRSGQSVTTYRITVAADGTEKKQTLASDTYSPQTAVIRVGTKPKPKPKIPVGPDGQPLQVKMGPDGWPVIGPDGKPILIKPAAKPVTKPAVGAKPTRKPGAKPPKKPVVNSGTDE